MPNSDREALARAIGGVLFNVSNFPEKAQTRLLGQDMAPLNENLTDAILAAGFRQAPPEVTDTLVDDVYALFVTAPGGMNAREAMRAALEAALGGTNT